MKFYQILNQVMCKHSYIITHLYQIKFSSIIFSRIQMLGVITKLYVTINLLKMYGDHILQLFKNIKNLTDKIKNLRANLKQGLTFFLFYFFYNYVRDRKRMQINYKSICLEVEIHKKNITNVSSHFWCVCLYIYIYIYIFIVSLSWI